MKKQLLLLIVSTMGVIATAQEDPQSKVILDKVSAKNTSYKTIKADFKYTVSSAQSQEAPHSESGKIVMKGNKYHLILKTTEILSDGNAVFTYLKGSNEINITKPESSDKGKDQGSFFLSNPKEIFKAYKDYKSKFVKENTIGNTVCYEIDLYPINIKNANYSRIRMHIDKTTLQIVDLKLFQKDGNQFFLELSSFQSNTEVANQEFVFDKNKYPKAQVNDMRF